MHFMQVYALLDDGCMDSFHTECCIAGSSMQNAAAGYRKHEKRGGGLHSSAATVEAQCYALLLLLLVHAMPCTIPLSAWVQLH
jgi:hypothetical protein